MALAVHPESVFLNEAPIAAAHAETCRRGTEMANPLPWEDLAMTFKPAIWHPIAVVLSALNLVGVGLATGSAEPWHAGVHAALALAFGLWAQRLRQGPDGSRDPVRLEVLVAVEGLEAEVSNMRRELSETQERLDFAERLLAQGQEARRVGPEG